MKTYIVTRGFAWRGSTWQRGATIKLSDNEATTPFVEAHVKLAERVAEHSSAIKSGYLGNGETKEKPEPPAKTIADAEGAQQGEAQGQDPASGQQGELDLDGGAQAGEMTAKQLRDALGKLGVPCPPNAKRGELAALYENAKAAVAGSQEH